MDPVLPTVTPSGTVTDGFGRRTNGIDSETGDEVELLEFAAEIVEHTGFVTALGERVARFATVRHASYVPVRRLARPSADRLQLVSDLTQGWRLSEMLEESAAANIPIDITVVIALLRQLLPAVALFGRHNRDAAIGVISAHRLIVTPQSRLVIAEHTFGPAIEKLNLGRDKLWRDFRVSMPPSAGLPRANQRGDAMAVGVVALTLLMGRALEVDEFPGQLQDLVDGVQEYRDGQTSQLSSSFSNWLKRALQFDVTNAFQTPSEAQVSFESVLASDRSYVTTSRAFIEWVSRIGITIENRRPPKPEVAARSATTRETSGELRRDHDDRSAVASAEAEAASGREGGPPPAPEAASPPKNELRRRLEEAAAVREVRREPEPERESAPSLLVGSNGETLQQVVEPEPESVPEPMVVVESEPEPVEEVNLLDEPEPQPAAITQPAQEPEPIPEPPRAQPRVEDDPIALQLLTYQPKDLVEPPPSVREREPEPEPEAQPTAEAPAESANAREGGPEPVAAQEPQEEAPREELPQYEAPAQDEPEPEEEPAPTPRLYMAPPPPPPPEPVTSDEEPSTDGPAEPSVPMAPAAEAVTSPPSVDYAADAPSDAAPARRLFGNPLVLGLAGVVIVLLGVMGWLLTRDTGGGMREGEGELVVQSRPEGAQVKIDGEVKGNTPLTVRLDSGAHVLEVQSGKSEPRVIPLMIQAGVQTSQYVELQGVAKTGVLEIRSDPPGARVTIDGRPRGTTPVTVRDLAPGDHSVVLEAGGRKVQQAVRTEAGGTAQLSVPMPPR